MLCNRLKYHLKNFSETTMNNIIKRFLLGNLLFTCVPLMSVSDGSINQLFEAAESGDFETLECSVNTALHKKIDFKNVRDNNGNSLLHAIMRGLQYETNEQKIAYAIEIIDNLVTSGLNVNIGNADLQTPAHKINTIQSASTKLLLLQAFQELGANFDLSDTSGRTLLGLLLTDMSPSTSNINSAAVQFLINNGHTALYTKLPRFRDNIIEIHSLTHHFIERTRQHLAGKENYSTMIQALYSSSEVQNALLSQEDDIATLQQKKGFSTLLKQLDPNCRFDPPTHF